MDTGFCVPDVPPSSEPTSAAVATSTASATASAQPSETSTPTAVPTSLTGDERFKKDFAAILEAAKTKFKSVRGARTYSDPSGHAAYVMMLTLEDCPGLAVWTRPTGDVDVKCDIVPNKPKQKRTQVVDILTQRLKVVADVIPADWTITRNPNAGPYSPQFLATDPSGTVQVSAHLIEREDASFDASLTVVNLFKPIPPVPSATQTAP